MSKTAERIRRLEVLRERAEAKLDRLRSTANTARGPVGASFAQKLADAAEECDRLSEHLKTLRLDEALTWSASDEHAGALQVCDEIGHRLDELFSHLDSHLEE